MSTWQKIVLCSSEKEMFIVEEEVMLQAETIKRMIEEGCLDNEIPVLDVDKNTLTKVIEYLTMHAHNKDSEVALNTWDAEFVNVDPNTLYDLMIAANSLKIRSLWDLLFNTMADMIKGKSVEEICKTFCMKNDFIPGEVEEEHRKENPYGFLIKA